MRFLSIYKHAERTAPPSPGEMATMGKLVEEGFKAGWLVATEGCLPTKFGARSFGQREADRDRRPFQRIQEVVGGFAILKVNSKEEAIELTRKFLQVAGDGECELRQIYEADTCAPAAAAANA